MNSRLGPEPYQISSGDSKDCAVYRQAGIVHRAFCGVARWVKGSMVFRLPSGVKIST
jgi:hypothetical protein